jgi:murein L,D-transpeptidase YcbB/YkuD
MCDARLSRLLILIAVITVVTSVVSCRQADSASQVARALAEITAGKPVTAVQRGSAAEKADVWTDVQAFYASREGAPAWVKDDNPSAAQRVLDVLRTAPAHGFAASDYGEADIAQRIDALTHSKRSERLKNDAPDRPRQLAELDARLTTALLALGRDVSLGRVVPLPFDGRAKSRRDALDLPATLAQATGEPQKWLDSVRPHHPEYAALEDALVKLRGQRDKGGWRAVPAGKFAPGASSPAMAALRQRLAASGHLSAEAAADTSPAFLKRDEAAVRAFQDLNGIKSTGIVDAATLAAMNVSIDERIRQIAVNLERWRQMPDDFGERHLIVNIPYFHLVAREHGKPVKDIRVVVGKTTNKTPVFSSAMTTVVFSPYWNIPDSIVEGETAPAVARDPAYLAKNNIEILDTGKGGGTPVEFASVNWDDAEQLRHLAFRQKPGPGNALGHVKFLFPNEYDVYLHDTPADALFARPGRAFSHGCVRVEEPEALAKYILGGSPEWDDQSILEAMNAGVEKQVKMKERIPVHIVYFTAWVDENGGLHFQPDIYRYDVQKG